MINQKMDTRRDKWRLGELKTECAFQSMKIQKYQFIGCGLRCYSDQIRKKKYSAQCVINCY